MGKRLSWAAALAAMAGLAVSAASRELLVEITPQASSARPEGRQFNLIPYVLRIEGLRLPGDRASRLVIYGQPPAKNAPVLGTAEGVGSRGGPKLDPPRNFVIPLSQEARRYLTGRRQAKLWVEYEGVTQLRLVKATVDISDAK
jgi:hypothetical protein